MTVHVPPAPTTEPNVTPLIDVLLVLLITFMIVTSGARTSMDVQLPQPCSPGCGLSVPIVLEVLPGPTYRVNQVDVAPGQLSERLRSIFAGRPDKTIHVTGRAGVSYENVITAMDVAKSAGVRVIGVAPNETPNMTR